MSLTHIIVKVSMGLLLFCTIWGLAVAQAVPESAYAATPADLQVKFTLKNAGNNSMVGNPDIPVIISVILTNKTLEPMNVFVTRYLSEDDSDPQAYPLGCAVRITDAKGTPLLQNKDHPDGYWSALKPDPAVASAYTTDSRNHFDVPPNERRAFNVPVAALLEGGGAAGAWPVVGGKFVPGAYKFKFRWAGQESPEYTLTILAN